MSALIVSRDFLHQDACVESNITGFLFKRTTQFKKKICQAYEKALFASIFAMSFDSRKNLATIQQQKLISFQSSEILKWPKEIRNIIAGGFAGLAGSLWAPFQRVANPEIAHWTFSAMPVLMTILGGSRSFFGPLVGAGVFLFLEQVIQSNQRYFWQWLASLAIFDASLAERQLDLWNFFLGLLLIPLILGFRGGLMAYIDKLAGKRS